MNRGFIALTLVISVSALLLAFSFIQSIETAHFFDETERKEYRLMSYYYAYACIDQALLILAHDYFFTLTKPIILPDLHCTIDLITNQDGKRTIFVHGDYQNIKVNRNAVAIVHDSYLEIIEIK